MPDKNDACRAKTKKGEPCRAAATETGYCYFHANPHIASQLGRTGGRKNRHVMEGAARALPALDTVTGVKDAIAQMIVDLHANRLHPRTAAGIVPLLNALLRALGAADLELRIKKLEKDIEELNGGTSAEKTMSGSAVRPESPEQ
jgi:hypothetical protein